MKTLYVAEKKRSTVIKKRHKISFIIGFVVLLLLGCGAIQKAFTPASSEKEKESSLGASEICRQAEKLLFNAPDQEIEKLVAEGSRLARSDTDIKEEILFMKSENGKEPIS